VINRDRKKAGGLQRCPADISNWIDEDDGGEGNGRWLDRWFFGGFLGLGHLLAQWQGGDGLPLARRRLNVTWKEGWSTDKDVDWGS